MTLPTIDQLKKALHLQEKIEKLQKELGSLFGRAGAKALGVVERGMKLATKGIQSIEVRKKPHFSPAARASIAKAQKARWAKIRAGKSAKPASVKAGKPAKKKGKISAAGRANIVKAQKARWAKVKAAKAKAGK